MSKLYFFNEDLLIDKSTSIQQGSGSPPVNPHVDFGTPVASFWAEDLSTGSITTWPDGGSEDKDATVTGTITVATTASLNNKKGVQLDGSSYLSTAAWSGTKALPNYVLAIVRFGATGSEQWICDGRLAAGRTGIRLLTLGYGGLYGGSAVSTTDASAMNNTNGHKVAATFSTTAAALRVDGSSEALGGTSSGTNTPDGFVIGANRTGGSAMSNGSAIAYVAFFDTLPDISAFEAWGTSFYGV